MRATLYEALGIPQLASDEEVRASLRGQIRKYYAKTRDGQGNVEEALRFINHASRILSNPEQRAAYDRELALSDGSTEQRIEHVATNAIGEAGAENTEIGPVTPPREVDELIESGLDAEDPVEPARPLQHAGLTEGVASFGRSAVVAMGVCLAFVVLIAAAILFVTPDDAVPVAKQVLFWLTVLLLALTVVYGVVHGLAWARRRHAQAQPMPRPQTESAILNWRREKSVFLGADLPPEDASWIFQLRMAELERAKAGRTSEPRPWTRLFARMFDYAIWGLVLALLVSEIRALGVLREDVIYWLSHPLVASIVITVTWIPIEALLIASLQTTPGKWLFGCYLQFSISNAYARRDPRAQLRRALRRGFRVWWQGIGGGVPLLAPVMVAVSYERLMQQQETDWDSAQDCLVTHGPPGALNTVTGICGLGAMLWLYGIAWQQPMADSIAWIERSTIQSLPASPTLIEDSIAGGGRVISSLKSGMAAGRIGTWTGSAFDRLVANDSGSAMFSGPVDAALDNQFGQRRARVMMLKAEGPRMLRAGNWRRAADLCGEWSDLDRANADAWRCYGQAVQAQGFHQKAIAAFQKAKQYDPFDRSIDVAIDRSQKGIVAEFFDR
ncbi:MAG: DnaJ domain-containing protein, partial [Betaproteobacteria bacterium]